MSSLPFTLRPKRAAHPGAPDMPRVRRSTLLIQAQQEEKENEKLAQAQSRKNTIANVAQLEAEIRQTHEERRRNAHNPPRAEVGRVTRSCQQGESLCLNSGNSDRLPANSRVRAHSRGWRHHEPR
jgi:hypothetical protein